MHKRKRQVSENPIDMDHLTEHFNKRFTFVRNPDEIWFTPNVVDVFNQEKWELNQFQMLKNELNNIKGQLSNFDLTKWSKHTKSRDSAGHVIRELENNIQPELLTQAWCKFYECICQFPLISENVLDDNLLNSVHLCEAPGAFICALNHYISINHPELKWEWIVNSLNPEYEGNNLSDMIPDKRLFIHTRENWRFGADGTGDVMKYYNYESFVSEALKLGKILLVTADGSVNCMSNPGEQECLVEHLHFCEIITALTILAEGGTFVLKMFTMFECSTICLLYLLNICFLNIHVFKPCTSKSGNSEVYIICLNYNGKKIFNNFLTKFLNFYKKPEKNVSMFPLKSIPNSFITQIENCCKYFMQKQIKTINNNISCFQNISTQEYRKNDHLKILIAQCFIQKYKLKPINQNRFLIKSTSINNPPFVFVENFTVTCSTFLLKKNFDLNFEIGRKIDQIFYSEYCDHFYLKKLIQSVDYDFKINIKNIIESEFSVLNFSYCNKDNKTNVLRMFQLFYNAVLKLNSGDNVIIKGCLFLTRLETGLFYLFMSCFTGIQYNVGVIVLKVVNDRISGVRELFNEINQFLINISNKDSDFEIFVLSILSNTLIQYEPFVTFLKSYNNKTLNWYFSRINKHLE